MYEQLINKDWNKNGQVYCKFWFRRNRTLLYNLINILLVTYQEGFLEVPFLLQIRV